MSGTADLVAGFLVVVVEVFGLLEVAGAVCDVPEGCEPAAGVCCAELDCRNTPAASKLIAGVKNLCISILSHWRRISAN